MNAIFFMSHTNAFVNSTLAHLPFVEQNEIDPSIGTAATAYIICLLTNPIRAILDVVFVPLIANWVGEQNTKLTEKCAIQQSTTKP